MYKLLRASLGIGILLWLVYFFDVKEIVNQFKQVDIIWIYLVGFAILVSTLLGAIGMFILVSRKNEIFFLHFLPIYWASWSIGLVVPGQIGDIASISLLLKRLGLEWNVILARSIADKIISLLVISAFAVYGLINIISVDLYKNKIYILVLTLLIICIFLFVYKWKKILNLMKDKKNKIVNIFINIIDEVFITVKNYPIRVSSNLILTICKIVFIGLAYWFMFNALGYSKIGIWEVIPLVAASSLIAYLPISLNGIGTVELTGILLFSTVGMPEAAVLTAYLLLRIIVFILAWVPTCLILLITREATSNVFS